MNYEVFMFVLLNFGEDLKKEIKKNFFWLLQRFFALNTLRHVLKESKCSKDQHKISKDQHSPLGEEQNR